MNKRKKEQKQKKYLRQGKVIERKIQEKISRNEAKLLLHVLVYHFDGFARQQQLINSHMATRFHWGNKRTARVLNTLAQLGVIDRWKSESDNWTLFFLVKGFLEECRNKIIRAGFAIKERMAHCFSAIFSIKLGVKNRTGT